MIIGSSIQRFLSNKDLKSEEGNINYYNGRGLKNALKESKSSSGMIIKKMN